MTLIEALVVMGLLLSTMALISTLFSYAGRSTKHSQERIDAHGGLVQAKQVIRKLVANSPRSGQSFFYQQTPGARDDLAVALLTNEDTAGQRGWDSDKQLPVFQGYHILYRNSVDNTLRAAYFPITPVQVAQPLSETQVRDAIVSLDSRPLARDITAFALVSPLDGEVVDLPGNPLGLQLGCTTQSGSPLKTQFIAESPNF